MRSIHRLPSGPSTQREIQHHGQRPPLSAGCPIQSPNACYLPSLGLLAGTRSVKGPIIGVMSDTCVCPTMKALLKGSALCVCFVRLPVCVEIRLHGQCASSSLVYSRFILSGRAIITVMSDTSVVCYQKVHCGTVVCVRVCARVCVCVCVGRPVRNIPGGGVISNQS